MFKKIIVYLSVVMILTTPCYAASALISSDCGSSSEAAANYIKERTQNAKKHSENVREAIANSTNQHTFNMLDCLTTVSGDLFSFAKINVLDMLKKALMAMAAKACDYTKTKSSEYINKMLEASSYTLPYGMGTVSATGTTIAGTTVNSGLSSTSGGSASWAKNIPHAKVGVGNPMLNSNP